VTNLNMDRETALRIALASRALAGIELPTLMEVLVDRLGNPITLESLSRITVTDLKTGLGSVGGEEDDEDIGIGLEAMKLAVRILWGETEEDDSIPKPDVSLPPLPDSIRVALASNTGANMDGHFGSCLRYLIYDISTAVVQLVDVRSAVEADFAEDKNGFRVSLIDDCQVLYVVSVGGPAAAKVIRGGIYPIKKLEGGAAESILKQLQQAMAESPPPWLSKILGVREELRLKNYCGVEVESE